MSIIENLESKYNEFKNIETNIENLNKVLDFYESCIPSFFHKGEDGEAENIKNIYKYIRENTDNNITINTIDINECGSIYTEYVDGMIQFINDIKDTHPYDDENLSMYKHKFGIAKENDSMFIESLFSGKINSTEDIPLSEAVGVIEYLIDFIPQIKSFKTTCELLQESVSDVSDGFKNNLLNYSINMLFESVNNYCYNTLNTIFNTYNTICESVFTDNGSDNSTETKFELF